MAAVWPSETSIVCGLWIQLFRNQSAKCFWNCVWSFKLWIETTWCALKQL